MPAMGFDPNCSLKRIEGLTLYVNSNFCISAIPYETDEELDRIIYDDILAEADRIADLRNGFIEANVVAADDPDRSW